MNEKPKNIWKRSWSGGRGLFFGWLILMAALAAIFLIWTVAEGTPLNQSGDELKLFVAAGIGVTFIFLLVISVRWVCCWRNFKRFLFGLACFATLIALFYAEEDWRGWHDWNQFKQKWEAKGEHFDYASITPPPVPDDHNFAMAPIWVESITATLGPKRARLWYDDKIHEDGRTNFTDPLALDIYHNNDWNGGTNGYWARETMTDLKSWQNYYRAVQTNRDSTIATNEFPVAPQPQTPAQDVLLALSKFDPVIEQLRQASKLPYSRFPLEYDKDDPAAILLPHLAALKRCSQVLQLRAIAELQNAESRKAMDDVKLSLRLMDSVHTEPLLISHLVRIAILQITLQPVYEGLAEHKWSDAQLVELDSELAKLDFLADYELSMRGERAFDIRIIEFLRHAHNKFREFANMTGHSPGGLEIDWPTIALSFGPSGWFDQQELNCARMMVEFYIPVADAKQQTVSPAAVRRADKALQAETKKATPYNILERMLLPALGNAVKKFAYAQSSVDLARTAIALERYRLAHGDYPDSLDALSPQFIAKVPHDVIGGQPLHYRLTDDGQFVLYSVGWNETDDGGVVILGGPFGKSGNVNINEGDWVWRYPEK